MSQELEYFAKKFNNSNVKILAVDDPAVGLYMRGNGITEVWEEKNSARVQIDAIPWSDYRESYSACCKKVVMIMT